VAYTTDDFVTDVRRDSFLPAVQSQWTPARILAVADKMLLRRVAPALINVGDGYYREEFDITLEADEPRYDFPRYAMFNKIYLAKLVGTDGETLAPLDVIQPSDLSFRNAVGSGDPRTLRFDANRLVLNPAPSSGSLNTWPTLRVWIYRRPGRMVPTTSAAQVSTTPAGTTVSYTGSNPATFTSSSVHDFYCGESPFRRLGSAITATGAGASSQDFASADAALLEAGDWVCLRDETVFPDCSIEVVPFLQELVIKSVSETQGDRAAVQTALQNIVEDMLQTIGTSANRADAMAKSISLMHSPFVRGMRRRGLPSTSDA
jgi:hypothetical protein